MENPEEFAAWAFAAGVPDPRGERYGYQPLIPAPCFPALSKMLWDLGFRHHDDLQTQWIPDYMGPDRNHIALGVTDVNPGNVVERAAEMVADQFPEVARRLSSVTAENRDQVVAEQAQALLSSMERLKQATAHLQKRNLEGP